MSIGGADEKTVVVGSNKEVVDTGDEVVIECSEIVELLLCGLFLSVESE